MTWKTTDEASPRRQGLDHGALDADERALLARAWPRSWRCCGCWSAGCLPSGPARGGSCWRRWPWSCTQALEVRRAGGVAEADPGAIGRVLASLDGLLGQGQDDE
jgi:hypothetical protein